MSELLEIARSSLNTTQNRLKLVGNNIVNVHTEGYHRQVGYQEPVLPSLNLYGDRTLLSGQGVDLVEVEQLFDQFAEREQRYAQSALSQVQKSLECLDELDNKYSLVGRKVTDGLSLLFDSFFKLADMPSDIAVRDHILINAEMVSQNLHRFQDELLQQYKNVNDEITETVGEVNQITDDIYRITRKSVGLEKPDLDIVDERTRLLKELSEHLNVFVNQPRPGSYQVLTQSGQTLVMESSKFQLSTEQANPIEQDVAVIIGSKDSKHTLNLKDIGGNLQALRDFRDDVLRPVMRELDVLAVSIAQTFNRVHEQGFDLHGQVSKKMFRDINEMGPMMYRYAPYEQNRGKAKIDRVEITDFTELTGHGYKLEVEQAAVVTRLNGEDVIEEGNELIFRLVNKKTLDYYTITFPEPEPDGAPIPLSELEGQFALGPKLADSIDGFNFKFNDIKLLKVADKFEINPTYGAARRLKLNLTSAEQIAAARGPSVTHQNPENKILVRHVDRQDPQFQKFLKYGNTVSFRLLMGTKGSHHELDVQIHDSQGLEVMFDDTQKPPVKHSHVILESDPSIEVNKPKLPQEVTLYGITFELDGMFFDQDEWTINVDFGQGDNTNASILGELQSERVMHKGTTTLLESYANSKTKVGTFLSAYNIRLEAVSANHEFAMKRVQEHSGVVLDEEAADMVRFQQIYQASAQVMSTAGVIIDTLLAIR